LRPIKLFASTALAIALIQPGMAVDADDSNDPIINKFLDASKRQQQALLGSQMEVDIDAKIPKLKEQGKMKFLRTVRTVPKLGQIFYRKLGEFVGDKTIQSQVIERYVELEEDGPGPGKDSIAITPANYKFRLKSKITMGDQQTYVFELTPKKKRDGLFKGELWLDAATGMPLREKGELVKNPSYWLKKVEFVNDFALQDGIAIPAHIECTIDTHLAGKAELSINFSNFARAEEASVVEVSNP
jgi:hypothetical protein